MDSGSSLRPANDPLASFASRHASEIERVASLHALTNDLYDYIDFLLVPLCWLEQLQ